MLARISTRLQTHADRAWDTVQKVDTLRYVTRGVLGFRPQGDVPERVRPGEVLRVRLAFFHIVPGWSHEIRIVRVDDSKRELYTNERGGPVRTWNHLIKIEPDSSGDCLYTDEIDIRAGPLTPLVWLYAQLFYRYRQRRWRKLARSLA